MKKYGLLLGALFCVTLQAMESTVETKNLELTMLKNRISDTFFNGGDNIIIGEWIGLDNMKQVLADSLIPYKQHIKSKGFVLLADNTTCFMSPIYVKISKFWLETRPWMNDDSDGYVFTRARSTHYQGPTEDSRRVDNGCRLALYCLHRHALDNIPLTKHTEEMNVLFEENQDNGLPLLIFVDKNVWKEEHAVLNVIKARCLNIVHLDGSSESTVVVEETTDSVIEEKEEEKKPENEVSNLIDRMAVISVINSSKKSEAKPEGTPEARSNADKPGPQRRDASWY